MPNTNTPPRLLAIWSKRAKRGPMDALPEVELRAGHGVVGNANIGGKRQVTIIEREVWDRHMATVGAALNPAARRANLMVEGLPLAASRGRVLCVGSARIRINGETRPCEQMDEAFPGLRAAMSEPWGGGVYGEVIASGVVRTGDAVSWAEGT